MEPLVLGFYQEQIHYRWHIVNLSSKGTNATNTLHIWGWPETL